MRQCHCVKSVRIQSFFGPYFHRFRLNTKICSVNLRIQSKCGEMRTRKTLNADTFHATCYGQLGDLIIKKNHRHKHWFQFSCANLTLIVFSVIFSRFYIYCSQLYSYLLFVLSFGRYRVFSRIFRWLLPRKKVILPRSSLQCKNL